MRGLSLSDPAFLANLPAPTSGPVIWIRDDFNDTAGTPIYGTQPDIYGPGGSATWVSRQPANSLNPTFQTFNGEAVARFVHNGSTGVNLTLDLGTLPSAFSVSVKVAFSANIYNVNRGQGFLIYLADTTDGVSSSNAFGVRFSIDTIGSNAGRLMVSTIAEAQLGSNISGISANTFYVFGFDVDGSSVTGITVKNMAGATLYSYTTPLTYSPSRTKIGLQLNSGTDTPPGYAYVDYLQIAY